MKKSLLNWIGRAVVVCTMSVAAATTSWAQTAGGQSVDSEFARELKFVEALKVYNAQLREQIAAQTKATAEIQASTAGAQNLEPQVAPLLGTMLSALDRFVAADYPFKMEERRESIARLRALMTDPGQTTSSRFRQIMDIYMAELEYGTTYEAYEAEIDGLPVDMLRVGRVGLYYQTKDQQTSAKYDLASRSWQQLPASQNRDIRKAIKVAAKTVAPELLNLTINAPEGA